MGDIHLINLALAGYGIAAGSALLLAAFIITIAAVWQHRAGARPDRSLAAAQVRRPAVRQPAEREPALR